MYFFDWWQAVLIVVCCLGVGLMTFYKKFKVGSISFAVLCLIAGGQISWQIYSADYQYVWDQESQKFEARKFFSRIDSDDLVINLPKDNKEDSLCIVELQDVKFGSADYYLIANVNIFVDYDFILNQKNSCWREYVLWFTGKEGIEISGIYDKALREVALGFDDYKINPEQEFDLLPLTQYVQDGLKRRCLYEEGKTKLSVIINEVRRRAPAVAID